MKKSIFSISKLLIALLFIFSVQSIIIIDHSKAQPTIQWQNTIGGSGWDELRSIQQTNDGGYILGGYSDSNISGDKTENSQGGFDYELQVITEMGTAHKSVVIE